MALVLAFSKNTQSSDNPQVIEIEHKGEKIYIMVVLEKNIRVIIDGPKTFKVDRTNIEQLRQFDAGLP